MGEVARRVDGRSFPELLENEICRPLGITTMFAGIPDGTDYREDFGLGYGVSEIADGKASVFGHGGYGGSNGFADLRSGLAVGFTKNPFHKEATGHLIFDELRRGLAD